MSIFVRNEKRVLLPLWSSTSESVLSSENKSLKLTSKPIVYLDEYKTEIILDEFQRTKEIGVAIDLLNTAIMENREIEACVAANFILSGDYSLPEPLINLARTVLGQELGVIPESEKLSTQNQISFLRKWLHKNPKDCLSWVDLSRLYSSIGLINHAEKAMIVGLALANNHRWVTRVASRFFYNIEKFDRAHHILSHHPDIKTDPWILSAELAISSSNGRSTKFWGQAKKMLELGIAPIHTTELESSVATLELDSGAIKKAKKLFITSLRCPNGNVLAQAKWAERTNNLNGLVTHEVLKKQSNAFEAKCWEAYSNLDMHSALRFGKKWLEEEPYSSEPAILASYIASLLDDYNESYNLSKKGLKINPTDETLKLNNLFSDMSRIQMNGEVFNDIFVDNAVKLINSLLKSDNESVIAQTCANLGMLYYKLGRTELGRDYYDKASKMFRDLKHPMYVLADLNHAREAIISKSPWFSELVENIEHDIKISESWSEPAAVYYIKKIRKLYKRPDDWRNVIAEGLIESDQDKSLIEEHLSYKFDLSSDSPTIWISRKK